MSQPTETTTIKTARSHCTATMKTGEQCGKRAPYVGVGTYCYAHKAGAYRGATLGK